MNLREVLNQVVSIMDLIDLTPAGDLLDVVEVEDLIRLGVSTLFKKPEDLTTLQSAYQEAIQERDDLRRQLRLIRETNEALQKAIFPGLNVH